MFEKKNTLVYHFEGNKGKYKFFQHILVSKQKGTTTKGAENCHLQAECRALEDITANSTESAKLFTHCTSESIELSFSLKIMIFFFCNHYRFLYAATRFFLWWMRDGTPTHCTNAVLACFNEKF